MTFDNLSPKSSIGGMVADKIVDSIQKGQTAKIGTRTAIGPSSNFRAPRQWANSAINTAQYEYLNGLSFDMGGSAVDISAGITSFDSEGLRVQLAPDARA